jgi:hypothetical protein
MERNGETGGGRQQAGSRWQRAGEKRRDGEIRGQKKEGRRN